MSALELLSARTLVAINAKRLRLEAKLTQDEVALLVGKSRQWVVKVERKQIAISLDDVDKLASVLEVRSCELLLPPTKEDLLFLAIRVGGLDVLLGE